jgi:ABC-type multidrug transport system permease subunit
MLVFLNILYTVAHLVLIGFNLTGWIWKRTRKAHLITLALTIGSWFVLGIWYGWGYCPLTDWHWDVKEKMGETNLPNSFIKYFADKITGSDINASIIDAITLGSLIAAVVASVYVNFFSRKKKMTQQ